MYSDEGTHPSVWEATADVPAYPAPDADLDTEVCVVGAGIAGLTTAYHLARAGRRVVVLDDGPVGGGESGRTTAHLATAFDDYYHEVERLLGAESARTLAQAFVAGVDAIERLVREESIACDFVRLDGWWFPATDDDARLLEDELEAARRVGLTDVELVWDWPLATTFRTPGLRFPRQAQFHILRYLAGLARAIERHGGRLYSGAHVVEVQDAEDGGRAHVKTDAGVTVRADHVVVATNTPVNDWVTMHTKQAAYRTYVVGLRVPRGAVPAGLYWDTQEPYHYVRLLDPAGTAETDVLLVGGEDHKTGQGDDEPSRFDALERWARAHFPVQDVVYRWSGQVLEPVDAVAYIGRNPGSRRVWIVTGDSGNGMTHGTIAGLLLPELIAGRADHPWAALFDPARITLKAAPEWLKENANVAAQYADLLTPGEVAGPDEIPAGEGRVVRRGATKLAVHRADDGTVTVRSALCPHLQCVVAWNAAEHTWDCPCHGSRFAPDGHVINGPATAPLPEASLD